MVGEVCWREGGEVVGKMSWWKGSEGGGLVRCVGSGWEMRGSLRLV